MAATDYNATITKGSTSVDIMIELVEYNFDKMLTDIQIPKQTTPTTWLIDLGRLKETITITGWFLDETGSSGLAKKTALRTILQSSGTMTLAWGTGVKAQSYTVNIIKGSIKELPERRGNAGGTETKTFNVMIQFEIGQHIG